MVFSNSSAGAETVALATQLVTAVLDAEPALAQPWTPSQPQPDLAELLGSWWSEGEELVLEVRDNQLWARLPGAGGLGETRFEREAADRFRAVQGRERGELLEVVRGDDGVGRARCTSRPMPSPARRRRSLTCRPTQRTARRRPDPAGPPGPERRFPMVDRGRLAELLRARARRRTPQRNPRSGRRTRPPSTCSAGVPMTWMNKRPARSRSTSTRRAAPG